MTDGSLSAAIIARARAGDADAFEAVYRANAGRVYALCLRLASDPADAAELTQDTFVRVWERLASFRGESALGTWIHRVAVTLFLERRRATGRRERRVEPRSDLDAIARPTRTDPVDSRLDLDRALTHLGDTARTVFVLHDMEGYDYREIEALTGTSQVALRSQLHRARKQLMERLDP